MVSKSGPLADKPTAEFSFKNFSIGAIREAPSNIVLIVATLAAPASDFKAALAMEIR